MSNKVAYYTRDSQLVADDGATASYTASGGANVAAAAKVFDMGADYADIPDFDAILDVTSTDNTTTDETYTWTHEQSTNVGFTGIISSDEVVLTSGIVAADKSRYQKRIKVVARYHRYYYTLGGTTPILVVKHGQLKQGSNY